MLDQTDQKNDGEALRDADYASLTRRATTDSSNALVDAVLHLIGTVEARKRRRGAKATAACKQAVERFLGDLLVALARAQHNEDDNIAPVAGWVHRSVSPNSFTGAAVSSRTFAAVRAALVALGLVEEAPGVTQFRVAFGKRFVQTRYDTRWRATAKLAELAAARGVSLQDTRTHFVPELPKHPLVLKGTSTWLGGYKISGRRMKIDRTDEAVKALEQEIIGLNAFIAEFDIGGGTHHGCVREFNCGDHPSFAWNLGGRLYSVGAQSYQGLKPAERKLMTIDGQAVVELDIRASALTIFYALRDQPLDFASNPDPYAVDSVRQAVAALPTARAAERPRPTLSANIWCPRDRALSRSRTDCFPGGSAAQPKLTESTKDHHARSPRRAASLTLLPQNARLAEAATMARRVGSLPRRPQP